MNNNLPARPNLEHLRNQAKTLLRALSEGDSDAAQTFIEHLPAASKMSAAEVVKAGFRLADAQSAVARKSGFASWPNLARHVDQLRSMEGTWEFESLEIEGQMMPEAAFRTSRILIDGDRFRMESPDAIYEGVFTIDVDAQPHTIDIHFVEGPEAGNRSQGLFELDDDRLKFALGLTGAGRPKGFVTTPASGHAVEVLRRCSKARPADVEGGRAEPDKNEAVDRAAFEDKPSPLRDNLQGEWRATFVSRDCMELSEHMLSRGKRSASGNHVQISFGGRVVIDALFRLDESKDPVEVDYLNVGGATKGIQLGITRWVGYEVEFCMAAPGESRPREFQPGEGITLSRWRKC